MRGKRVRTGAAASRKLAKRSDEFRREARQRSVFNTRNLTLLELVGRPGQTIRKGHRTLSRVSLVPYKERRSDQVRTRSYLVPVAEALPERPSVTKAAPALRAEVRCVQRREYRKEMLRKVAAQVAAGGRGKLRLWRERRAENRNKGKC